MKEKKKKKGEIEQRDSTGLVVERFRVRMRSDIQKTNPINRHKK
jgi:hypothetical protein